MPDINKSSEVEKLLSFQEKLVKAIADRNKLDLDDLDIQAKISKLSKAILKDRGQLNDIEKKILSRQEDIVELEKEITKWIGMGLMKTNEFDKMLSARIRKSRDISNLQQELVKLEEQQSKVEEARLQVLKEIVS